MAKMNKEKKDATGQVPPAFGFGGIFDGIQKLLDTAAKLKDAGQLDQTGEFSVPGLGVSTQE